MGLALKELREAKGIDQDEVAEVLGLETSTISRKESGKIAVGRHQLRAFAKALKSDVQTILRLQGQYLRMEQHESAERPSVSAEVSVVRQMQSALESVGDSLADVCETSSGRRRQVLLDQIVAYAKWLAETSRHADDIGADDPVIGRPYTGPMLKAPPILLDDGTVLEKYVPALTRIAGADSSSKASLG